MAQAYLAVAAGVTKATVSGIETGKHEAWPSTARKLATALGVKLAALTAPAADANRNGSN